MFWLAVAFVPPKMWKWLGALFVGLCMAGGLAIFGIIGGAVSGASSGYQEYQCVSAVGPDPSATATPTFGIDDTLDPSEIPTTNPFASQTVDAGASQWERDCVDAMNTAPLQLPPVGTVNADTAASCARSLAIGQEGDAVVAGAGNLSGPTGGGFSPEGLTRYVIYTASTSTTTGRCDGSTGSAQPSGRPEIVAGPTQAGDNPCVQAVGAAALPASSTLVIPGVLATQGLCGQRVAVSAVSPGDLVFWNYSNDRPTRVGVAVGSNEIVADNPATGRFALQANPTTADTIVKRFLG